jgi:ion channel-forming bestrophin family protein
MMFRDFAFSALATIALLSGSDAFQPARVTPIRQPTVLGPVAKSGQPDPLSYSEQSRAYRRDFYTHDSWLKARSKNRFVGTITKFFDSGVVRQLVDEIILVGAIATTVVLWNALFVAGYDDFSMVHHAPILDANLPLLKLPGEPFTLSSPALSLLLGK